MKITTRNFGEIEIEEEMIITFEEGIPGFEMLRRFVFIDGEEKAFNYLQSVEDGEICFVITDPYQLFKEYAPVINESYFEKLGGGKDEEFAIYSVVCLRDSIEESSINLAGPLLIQTEYKKGIQVITEDRKYSTRHKFIDLLERGN